MSSEDWVMSRNKLAKLDEYFENWINRLNECEDQLPIVIWLKNQIETYKVCSFT